MTERSRSWWGWGWADEVVDGENLKAIAAAVGSRLNIDDIAVHDPPDLTEVSLRAPRLRPPASLAPICSDDPETRAGHTYGKSFRDVVRALHGDLPNPPDVVAFPTTEAEIVDVLDWCGAVGAAAIPYGGGSSVTGGVEPAVGDDWGSVVTLDLSRMGRVMDIDGVSRTARIEGGALGPVLEDQLRPHGYSLRHFPQSFEFSTLGGWLATRSGGHYATVYTHIDDMVESMRVVTPSGTMETRRLPGSGAGPSPDRLFLGSEGILGVIVEASMRIQDRPVHKATAAVRFRQFEHAVEATRAIAQSALFPSNCRLLDGGEATGAGVDDGSSLLVVGFESADHPVEPWIERAVAIAADHGGSIPEGIRSSSTEGSAGAWRSSFMRAPYGRDAVARVGCIAETFETACTWDAFPALHAGVTIAVEKALAEVCGGGIINCRFTHVYPDGPAPYFTVLAPSRWGSQIAMWDEIKAAAGEALLKHGGTITHHHSVGRDHRPWYDRQRPDLFADVLRAAKQTLDPTGMLNPGVLIGA